MQGRSISRQGKRTDEGQFSNPLFSPFIPSSLSFSLPFISLLFSFPHVLLLFSPTSIRFASQFLSPAVHSPSLFNIYLSFPLSSYPFLSVYLFPSIWIDIFIYDILTISDPSNLISSVRLHSTPSLPISLPLFAFTQITLNRPPIYLPLLPPISFSL